MVVVLRPPTLQMVVPGVLLEPSRTLNGPPINSPKLFVPLSRAVKVMASFTFVPRLKLALELPKLYAVVPLLNRRLPIG